VSLEKEILKRIAKDKKHPAVISSAERGKYSSLDGAAAPVFNLWSDKRKGYVPKKVKKLYFLIDFYRGRCRAAKPAAEKMEYAALEAAVRETWNMEIEKILNHVKIRRKLPPSIIITDNWLVCARECVSK
jgi:hypothetical protein